MPIQAPQWTDYLNCPVCCREFGAPPRSPISLGCGHTLCRHCLKHLHRKQCPFDQTVIQLDPEELVVNTALLQLAGYNPPAQPYHSPSIQALQEHDKLAYDCIVKCMEQLAGYFKFCASANNLSSRLSRPMQRKLVTLLQCAVTDEEARGRAARAARSLGERTVTELILQHQNPQQLSANLWAAVRARGCQFLGPAMQEEVLKLVLLALEDGSALSRKVLVMFVVQRLEPHFPQASKTSIGHVVQLLYRASCFKVSKRECDSSLMQLKEEFRTYESLRREHDAQVVQIATEAGLRIAPDQWSALLYGDTAHKSHMQSIIDKLQSPQSFAQSVQELFIALQRTGDTALLIVMSRHLDRLTNIDPSPDAKSPTWQQLAEIMTSLKEVVAGLIHYLQQQAAGRDANHNQKHVIPERCLDNANQGSQGSTPTHAKYKVAMCRDAAVRSFCPRGNACTFAHSEEELERFRDVIQNGNGEYYAPPRFIMRGLNYDHGPRMPTANGDPQVSYNVPPPPPPPMIADIAEMPPTNGHPRFNMHPMNMGQALPANEPLPPLGMDRVLYYHHHEYNGMPVEHPGPMYPEYCPRPPPPPYVPNVPMVPNVQVVTNGFNVGNVGNVPNVSSVSNVPNVSSVSNVPNVGNMPNVGSLPNVGNMPNVPTVGSMSNVANMYPRAAREELFDPLSPEFVKMFASIQTDDRNNAVWAPNPGECCSPIYPNYQMREPITMGSPQYPDGYSAVMVYPRPTPRSSPVEGLGPRTVGGPILLPTNGPSGSKGQGSPGSANGAQLPMNDHLVSVRQVYQESGLDDKQLEEGLLALKRRIDVEFEDSD